MLAPQQRPLHLLCRKSAVRGRSKAVAALYTSFCFRPVFVKTGRKQKRHIGVIAVMRQLLEFEHKISEIICPVKVQAFAQTVAANLYPAH